MRTSTRGRKAGSLFAKTRHRSGTESCASSTNQLENEFWHLLYEFGYPTLNIGRSFQVVVADKQDGTVTKQIDVFGYDDETVIIGECKACEKRTKRSLQKDIGELASLQKSIAVALRKHFGGKFEQKLYGCL